MAITITPGQPRLSVTPTRGKLPFAITLSQDLGSTSPPEQADVLYVIRPQFNVFFQTAGGPPSKTLAVTRMVTQASGQTFTDQVTLVAGAGEVAVQINIGETIKGQSGGTLHASCLVNITTG